tara:strand:+ start:2423 stop:3361 length:939 start_codon:yes stop_codon:yes gene_type:complete
MSAGKSKTSERSYVPPFLQDLYTKVSEKGLEELPFTPYSGQMVAGLTPDQIKAMTTTRSIFDQSFGFDPRQSLNEMIMQGSPTVNSASIVDNISSFENPYQDQVIDNFIADQNKQRDYISNRAEDAAIRADAFSGSRGAIFENEATRPLDEITANTIAGLRLKGFQDAAKLAAQQAKFDQQANLLQPQLNLKQMGLQANLLNRQLTDQLRNLGLLSNIGAQQQRLDQAQLAADRAEFDRRINDPFRQLQYLSSAIAPISPSVIGRDSKTKSFSLDAMDIMKGFTGLGMLGMGPLSGASSDVYGSLLSGDLFS